MYAVPTMDQSLPAASAVGWDFGMQRAGTDHILILAHVLGAEAWIWDERALLHLLSSCSCLGVYSWCDVCGLDPHCELSLRISILIEGKEEGCGVPLASYPLVGFRERPSAG